MWELCSKSKILVRLRTFGILFANAMKIFIPYRSRYLLMSFKKISKRYCFYLLSMKIFIPYRSRYLLMSFKKISKRYCFYLFGKHHIILGGIRFIIIIMSCRQHGYSWPSLATSPYRSSPLAGLQGYIPYPHIAAVCMFELVVLLLLSHMSGSIGVYYLWARLRFSSCVLHIWLV